MLKSEQLTVGYAKGRRNNLLFASLSFEIKPGEMIGVLGKNGIGKSTLLRTCAGQLLPYSGSVTLEGRGVHLLTARQTATSFCLMLPGRLNVPFMTVADYLFLRTQVSPSMNHSIAKEQAYQAALFFAIDGLWQRDLVELSEGEFQKVALAGALASGARWLLLDEPTAHLDFKQRHNTFTALKRLCSTKQKGVLMATHELDLALAYTDHLILLQQEGNCAFVKTSSIKDLPQLTSMLYGEE